jgi:hypothetical protein
MAHRKRPMCAEVRSWLLHVTEHDHHQVIAAWSEHMAGCEHCRGALMLLATELLGQPVPAYTHATCGECQRDLAGYLDLMQIQGHTYAARRYPHVWWHLWTCGECAATSYLTSALVEAEAHGELAPLSSVLHSSRFEPPTPDLLHHMTFVLPRALLIRALGTHNVGSARGDDGSGMTLAHNRIQSYSLHMTLSDMAETTCCFCITTTPPSSGWVSLRLGERLFQAPFDPSGEARIAAFPLALLRALEGPDVIVTLHPDLPPLG